MTGFNGRLTVGEEGSPFQHKATITLTGRIGTPDLLLARDMNLGSKALGIFSNVSCSVSLLLCGSRKFTIEEGNS